MKLVSMISDFILSLLDDKNFKFSANNRMRVFLRDFRWLCKMNIPSNCHSIPWMTEYTVDCVLHNHGTIQFTEIV